MFNSIFCAYCVCVRAHARIPRRSGRCSGNNDDDGGQQQHALRGSQPTCGRARARLDAQRSGRLGHELAAAGAPACAEYHALGRNDGRWHCLDGKDLASC